MFLLSGPKGVIAGKGVMLNVFDQRQDKFFTANCDGCSLGVVFEGESNQEALESQN